MPDASSALTTIAPREAAHFGTLAADWWNPKGASAMLHRLNPVRLRYIRERIDRQFGTDPTARSPLTGRTALDMGCGAGLVCEPLARLGATVVGVDAAPENIVAAQDHAAAMGLEIDYRSGDAGAIGGKTFDLVTSLEVIEHVADPAHFIDGLAAALAPGGLMILSTPNRTAWSRLAMVTIGEGVGSIPRGTHDWDKFLTPEVLTGLLTSAGLNVTDIRGFAYDPVRGARTTDDLSLDYFVAAVRA